MARPNTETRLAEQMLRKRIAHGDYALTPLPSERQLAEELGFSRQTLRNAVQTLIDENIFRRTPKGRLEIVAPLARGKRSKPIIGFLHPAAHSIDIGIWVEAVYAALEGYNVIIRSMTYEHIGESIISSALDEFDGLFFLPPSVILPDWLLTRMFVAKARVVMLDHDASAHGVRSVSVFPPASELKLLRHLHQLGHRRIDCINVHPVDAIIEKRIDYWRQFIDQHQIDGQLFTFTEFKRFEASYQLIKTRLRDGLPLGTAFFCTTIAGALGSMRALKEAGLTTGADVSICAVNDGGLAPYLNPTLTCLQSPPRAAYLRKPVAWMLGKEDWDARDTPLLIQPDEAPLFIGESTGAPR
ncbi:GntR family transcriptional regulator [Opitutaceae bacterium TAV4]|nr:GntR family transcriptional regulator [Opitutaceae bacterium TAV4]RRJ98924.1 GntR family transcriptional regulator [Opitutaceae bacterium TAV3]